MTTVATIINTPITEIVMDVALNILNLDLFMDCTYWILTFYKLLFHVELIYGKYISEQAYLNFKKLNKIIKLRFSN